MVRSPESAVGRTEIHFHLLPGVDDGPATMEESIELARLAIEDGTETIVNTPHVSDVELGELGERLFELLASLKAEGLDIQVLCGGELAAEDVGQLSQPDLEQIAQGPADSRWLLLESPHDPRPDEFIAAADELRDRGFAAVIAHPERSRALDHGRSAVIAEELAAGSWLQVSGDSLAGAYGEEVRAAGIELIDRHKHVVVSSDAHGVSRPPQLTNALHEARRAGIDPARVRHAVETGPVELMKLGVDGTSHRSLTANGLNTQTNPRGGTHGRRAT
jgi:protein-tyrosine phosphatase